MGTTISKKDIATTGSGHRCVTPPAVSMNPPAPPGVPVPVPYAYSAEWGGAKETKSTLEADGNPVLVVGSTTDIDPPGNQPSKPTGGDIVTHGVMGKATVAEGSSATKAGGKPVSATGDTVRVNLMMPKQAVAQQTSPLLRAGGADAAGGKGGSGAGSGGATKRARAAEAAKKCTKA